LLIFLAFQQFNPITQLLRICFKELGMESNFIKNIRQDQQDIQDVVDRFPEENGQILWPAAMENRSEF